MGFTESWKENRKVFLGAIGGSILVWAVLLVTAIVKTPEANFLLPPAPPVTVPFDKRLSTGSDDLPIESLQKEAGDWDPEQIHLSLAEPGAVYVSWATHNSTIVKSLSDVKEPDVSSIASEVQWGTDPNKLQNSANGSRTNYVSDYPDAIYVSGIFHHVKIQGLAPETVYYYRCGDPAKAWSSVINFTMPKAVGPNSFPQKLGFIGDLGQTYNSTSTLAHLEASNPPVVILVGDFSYSDSYTPKGKPVNRAEPRPTNFQNSYQPRWDAWGRLTQPAFSSRTLQGLHGNHEIEMDASNKTFQAFTNRYKTAFQESNSSSPHFYSFDVAGAHVVHLASYQNFSEGSSQMKWLRGDLQRFSRSRTPWLIANFHAPWYHTYTSHYKEASCHQLAVEKVLYDAGVDLIFTGHVHAYAASNRVYNWTLDECGPHHIVIGDGGNVERLYTQWVDEDASFCPEPSSVACPTFQDGRFCPSRQPDWSAYREPSFGHGILELQSPTGAVWRWHRNQDGAAVVAHELKIERNLQCANQRKI